MLFLFESFEVKTWYLLKMPSLYGKMNLAMSPVNFHAAVSDTDLAWVTQVKKQHLEETKSRYKLCRTIKKSKTVVTKYSFIAHK